MMNITRPLPFVPAVALAALVGLSAPAPAAAPARPDPDMKMVLDELAALGGKPIETLAPREARRQPTPADAVKALLAKQGKSTAPEPVGEVVDATIPGPAGPIAARVYKPAVGAGPFPVIVYFHGGGWVIADLDVYDATPRALVNATGAMVVSSHYRQGPEHRFPAAHDDAMAAYTWVAKNAATWGGDPTRLAVAGESAGGNLAANVARMARKAGTTPPRHQLLVYPIAGHDMDTPSYRENAAAKPLNKPMMAWFFDHYLRRPADGADPRISLVKAPDLAGLAPATIVLAQIDPLRSEGAEYGERLRAAGVDVVTQRYDGVAHEFFGMGAVVAKAKDAVAAAGGRLKSSLNAR